MSFGVAAGWASFIGALLAHVGLPAVFDALTLGSHLYMSDPANRDDLTRLVGGEEKKFLALYSAVSLATFIPTSYYWARNRGHGMKVNKLRNVPGVGLLSDALTIASVMTFAGAIAAPSPIKPAGTPVDPLDRGDPSEPRGMNRITRHPVFWALSYFALARCLTSIALVDLIYWGGYPLLTVVGGLHQDERKRKTMPKAFFEQTSFWPFQAIIEGRQSMRKVVEDIPQTNLFVGAALGLAIVAVRRKGGRAVVPKQK